MPCCLMAPIFTVVDLLSKMFCDIKLTANSHDVLMNLIHNMHAGITLLKLQPHP